MTQPGPQVGEQLPCEVCSKFGFSGSNQADLRYDIGASLFDLGVSGHEGCETCLLIYECCVQVFEFSEDADFQKRCLVTIASKTSLRLNLESVYNTTISGLGGIEIYFENGRTAPPWDNIKPGRNLLRSRRLEYGSLISQWVSACDTFHEGCQRSIQNLPTRVLNIGCNSADVCNLFVSHGVAGLYTALSYCWGKVPFLRATQSNIHELQKAIKIDSLPIGFQDAIAVTRALGIQYLWIDSLCIIQDDVLDWEVESSKMAEIYQGASVVLASTQASDPQIGLLDTPFSLEGNRSRTSVVARTVKNADGSDSCILARLGGGHGLNCDNYLETNSEVAPLETRAWTLQERLLATRIIHFTDKELLWECTSSSNCECMEMDNTPQRAGETKNFWRKAQSDLPSKRQEGWRELVSVYSSRQLTYENDRLPALSGIVKHLQSRGAGQYLAGIWLDDLLQSILWEPPQELDPYYVPCRRAVPYRAPTWSWISLDHIPTSIHEPGKTRRIALPKNLDHFQRLARPKAKVMDALCISAGKDPTGALRSGYIVLWGKFVQAAASWLEPRFYGAIRFGTMSISVKWDIQLDLSEPMRLYCLLIGEAWVDSGDRRVYPKALVLQESKEEEAAFERVGVLGLNGYGGGNINDLFLGARKQIVKIY